MARAQDIVNGLVLLATDTLEMFQDNMDAEFPLPADQTFKLPNGEFVQVILMEADEKIFNRENS